MCAAACARRRMTGRVAVRCHALPGLGGVVLGELEPLRLQDLYARLSLPVATGGAGLSAGSVRNLHLVLGQAFGQAVRWRLIASSPAAGVQPPRARRPHRVVVDPPLLRRLLAAAAGDPLEAAVALAAATGMRRGEILALRWADVNEAMSQLRVRRTLQPTRPGLVFEQPKTPRSRRTVALPGSCAGTLERHRTRQSERQGHGADGRSTTGRRPRRRRARGTRTPLLWLAALPARQGLPAVRFHDLRHAHATLLLIQGVHPKIVSERLGHASVGITLDTYSHVLPRCSAKPQAFDQLFPTLAGG